MLPSHLAAQAVVDWLNEGGSLSWRLRTRLSWNAFWFERLLQNQPISSVVTTHRNPAFIMGFWRSGTTLLHNLLYSRYVCTTPLTWQCHAPATFRLQTPPHDNISVQRPMDDGMVHLLGPQEDEIALLLLGEPSLYRGFLDPTRLEEIAEACLTNEVAALPRWRAFLARIAADAGPLLLKSPNHVFRLTTIANLYPDAPMIWICRPSAQVVISNLRMWGAMIDRHRLRAGDINLIAFIERLMMRYRDIVTDQLVTRSSRILWVNYNNLVTGPDAVCQEAAAFLRYEQRKTPLSETDAHVHPGRTERLPALPNVRLQKLAAEIDELHAIATSRQSRTI
jgi:hypothetical protein